MTVPSIALDGFEDVHHIGAGGLGDVYQAVRTSTRGRVAIKLLREYEHVDDLERRIGRELEALLLLKGHPAVVQIEEILQTDHGPALVMEFAGGGSLLHQIQHEGPLDVDTVCRIGVEVGGLLADAHHLGIIHRDIKPHNVLRTSFGWYKVCDFGIAALSQSEMWADQTAAVSARYASPEELDGHTVTAASDVFSLGVTLIQARTGRTHGIRSALTAAFPDDDPRDPDLRRLLARMVVTEPQQRPTAATVRDAFRVLAAGPHPSTTNPVLLPPDDGATVVRPRTTPPGTPSPSSTGSPPRPDDTPATAPRPTPTPAIATGLPRPADDDEWWT